MISYTSSQHRIDITNSPNFTDSNLTKVLFIFKQGWRKCLQRLQNSTHHCTAHCTRKCKTWCFGVFRSWHLIWLHYWRFWALHSLCCDIWNIDIVVQYTSVSSAKRKYCEASSPRARATGDRPKGPKRGSKPRSIDSMPAVVAITTAPAIIARGAVRIMLHKYSYTYTQLYTYIVIIIYYSIWKDFLMHCLHASWAQSWPNTVLTCFLAVLHSCKTEFLNVLSSELGFSQLLIGSQSSKACASAPKWTKQLAGRSNAGSSEAAKFPTPNPCSLWCFQKWWNGKMQGKQLTKLPVIAKKTAWMFPVSLNCLCWRFDLFKEFSINWKSPELRCVSLHFGSFCLGIELWSLDRILRPRHRPSWLARSSRQPLPRELALVDGSKLSGELREIICNLNTWHLNERLQVKN